MPDSLVVTFSHSDRVALLAAGIATDCDSESVWVVP